MDDGTEEYMLKWNSHNTEVISEFHELCRVSNKFSTNMYTYLYVSTLTYQKKVPICLFFLAIFAPTIL